MAKKLTIMVAPMEGVGHVNACIGLAEVLVSRGHKIVFVCDQSYEGRLSSYGFIEEIIEDENEVKGVPGEQLAKGLLQTGLLSGLSAVEKLKIMKELQPMDKSVVALRKNEPKMKALVDKYNPDVIIIDNFAGSPALIHSGKPWVFVFSGNPLFVINDPNTPPAASGFLTNGDRSEWKDVKEMSRTLFWRAKEMYNKWMTEEGFPTVKEDKLWMNSSPFLNIYGYPEELDYIDIRPIPPKWLRVDAFMRCTEQDFELPDKLLNRDETKSKLIYLSMGSMGSIDVNLMKKFVSILSKSNHKFIVSKGVLGDTYELSDNMWGQNSVPQTRVLPLVDVVITHGGNNSVTETFSFGKPMIVMPLFVDQFDNAQRVQEKGFGLRLDPYNCSDEELINSIEKLLNDNEMKARLSVASKRMLHSDSNHEACEAIENLIKT